jgi:hypothetical protein
MKGMPRALSRAKSNGLPVTSVETVALVNLAISVADGAPGFGNVAIANLPKGDLVLLGAMAELQFTSASGTIINAWTGTYSVGTVGTANNQVTDPGEATIIQATTISAATLKVSPETRGVHAIANSGLSVNNQAGTTQLFLNLLVDDASISGAAAFTVTGKVRFAFANLGI